MDNAINWFEILVRNFERARKFYSTVLGVRIDSQTIMGMTMGFFPANGVSGALVKGKGYIPSTRGSLVYLNGGRDLKVILSRVRKAGGVVLLPKTFISKDIGFMGMFIDCEGNKVALHSPK